MVSALVRFHMNERSPPSLEELTRHILHVQETARICKDADLILAVARLRDHMAKSTEVDTRSEARHRTIEGILAQRVQGKNKRVWWAGVSEYQGEEWAVGKLTGLSRKS